MRAPKLNIARLTGAAILLAVPLSGMAAPKYKAFDYIDPKLGFEATITEAFGINDLKMIAGSFCLDNGPALGTTPSLCSAPRHSASHGYIGTLTNWDSPEHGIKFVRIDFPNAFEPEATAINTSGLVVGLFDKTYD